MSPETAQKCLPKLRHLYKNPKVLLGFQAMALNFTLQKRVANTLHFKIISQHISAIVNPSKSFLVCIRQNIIVDSPPS